MRSTQVTTDHMAPTRRASRSGSSVLLAGTGSSVASPRAADWLGTHPGDNFNIK